MPKWLETAVFYEIYPQSFNDTNSDGIGDINGITEKLDYIKSIGFNAIWMNPCFASPFNDAGYDVEDYYKVAPRYGTNEDLENLFKEAHKRDMHILLDLVPGHTAWNHEWFKKSSLAEKNEYTDRYVWTDTVWNENIPYPTIRGLSERDGSAIVNFFSHQPALNYGFYETDPNQPWQQSMNAEGPMSTRNELKNIIAFWLKKGCDGFRVDMAFSLVKGDPEEKGTIALWQDVREYLDKEFPDAAFVSEWGNADHSLAAGFHMDFLLHFGPSHYTDLFRCDHPFFNADGKGTAKAFVERYVECYKKTAGRGLICLPSGNHDMYRLPHFLDDRQLRLALTMVLSFAGTPFVYYGDEIGMRYIKLNSKEGGYFRTGSRTPMQWDNSKKNCGFSDGNAEDLYLPIDPEDDRPNVADQLGKDGSVLELVKKLNELRAEHEALHNMSDIEFVAYESFPMAYLRKSQNETILVVINPKNEKASFDFDKSGETVFNIGGGVEFCNGQCRVAPQTAVYVKIK